MAPSAISPEIHDVVAPKKDTLGLPEPAHKRLTKAGIDLSNGYPYRPSRPLYLDDVYKIRNEGWNHVEAGARADKSKSALLSAATKVTDLTAHIGTEIEGLQLKDLTDQQRDELSLLIAERSVVFFRDQDLSPQQQKELGKWYGEIEIHVRTPILRETWLISSAASSSCARRSRSDGHMAGSASHGSTSKLPKARWCISLAHGLGP
jgi:hypothetical protein